MFTFVFLFILIYVKCIYMFIRIRLLTRTHTHFHTGDATVLRSACCDMCRSDLLLSLLFGVVQTAAVAWCSNPQGRGGGGDSAAARVSWRGKEGWSSILCVPFRARVCSVFMRPLWMHNLLVFFFLGVFVSFWDICQQIYANRSFDG